MATQVVAPRSSGARSTKVVRMRPHRWFAELGWRHLVGVVAVVYAAFPIVYVLSASLSDGGTLTGSNRLFADVSTALTGVPSGTQTVHLTFTGSGSGLFDVDDFTLVRGTASGGTGPIKGLAGKCLDVRNGSSADGTQIQLYTCNGSTAQAWTVTPNGPVKALGKCLDVSGGGNANGTKIQLYACNGTGAQNWSAQADGTVRNPQSGKCLDVSGNNSADGTAVHLWTCTGAANQRWTLP